MKNRRRGLDYSERGNRRTVRLQGYDYSQNGAYFVTVCTGKRKSTLGAINDGKMVQNQNGEVVQCVWSDLPKHYPYVELDEFVVMPNHLHGILFLAGTDVTSDAVGAGFKPAQTEMATARHGLSEIVRALKTFSARLINAKQGTPGRPVWQRNYYEHVIRDEDELIRAREYIVNNPTKWELDRENPDRKKGGVASHGEW